MGTYVLSSHDCKLLGLGGVVLRGTEREGTPLVRRNSRHTACSCALGSDTPTQIRPRVKAVVYWGGMRRRNDDISALTCQTRSVTGGRVLGPFGWASPAQMTTPPTQFGWPKLRASVKSPDVLKQSPVRAIAAPAENRDMTQNGHCGFTMSQRRCPFCKK